MLALACLHHIAVFAFPSGNKESIFLDVFIPVQQRILFLTIFYIFCISPDKLTLPCDQVHFQLQYYSTRAFKCIVERNSAYHNNLSGDTDFKSTSIDKTAFDPNIISNGV